MILGTEAELKKVETAVSNRLGILPKTRGGSNSAKVVVKAASSETMIVYLVYWTCLECSGSVKCLFISLPGHLAVI